MASDPPFGQGKPGLLAVGERGLDAGDSERWLLEGEASVEPQDAVAKPGEETVPTGIGLGATAVRGAIDFDDEPS